GQAGRNADRGNGERPAVASEQAWRHPAQVASQWMGADRVDGQLLSYSTRGDWWGVLRRIGVTLLVSREYEHLLIALRSTERGHQVSYLPIPHPSGIVVDRPRNAVHVAVTRNPNQVFELAPAEAADPRTPNRPEAGAEPGCLIPVRSHAYPGRLYLHDLAIVG